MMVFFQSECNKKALLKTRRILDLFANRIGRRTWQTVITMEGLKAIKDLLKKSASKSTSVCCTWIHGRSRTEVLWIVGNKNKFNANGRVPVNRTRKEIVSSRYENSWYYLPLIRSLVKIAGLFHDFGKSSDRFQGKLVSKEKEAYKNDPVRHEWISALLFVSFIGKAQSDKEWIATLAEGNLDSELIIVGLYDVFNQKKPFNKLPFAAGLIVWLIMTHHKLPCCFKDDKLNSLKGVKTANLNELLIKIQIDWSFIHEDAQSEVLKEYTFPEGLPSESNLWVAQIKKWALRLIEVLPLLEKVQQTNYHKVILYYSRLCLMLGDYNFSAEAKNNEFSTAYTVYANTDDSANIKQHLDEHLIGVSDYALKMTWDLPKVEYELEKIQLHIDKRFRSNDPNFAWQEKAVRKIKKRNTASNEEISQAVFIVNMASTGCGKTLGNAKIMNALNEETGTRYILALGLRCLTLQTGEEYRNKIGLSKNEMAVLIGSEVFKKLFSEKTEEPETENKYIEENILEGIVDYEGAIPEEKIKTLLKKEKHRKLLFAPIVVCTIDHIMDITETIKGGKWMLPFLRLMSSDLVIDEIDDFSGSDLIAIGRLIHMAGMLGRKVMISSATIPPAIAEGYFKTYMEGYSIYAGIREQEKRITCIWVDEFRTDLQDIINIDKPEAINDFRVFHQKYTNKRVSSIRKNEKNNGIKRKGSIIPCSQNVDDVQNEYFKDIRNNVAALHSKNHVLNSEYDKKISFGCVRMANINPCIELFLYLAENYLGDDYELKVMTYHARQILLLRSYQENHLDEVLKCKDGKERNEAFSNDIIINHIKNSKKKNIIFIVVATPVEEVGRDHDFDWAILEPSSYRSIIQMAGRVRRHRKRPSEEVNIGLLQFNYKGIQKKSTCFIRPGYESWDLKLETHDLFRLINKEVLEKSINSIPRIQLSDDVSNYGSSLINLEHYSMKQVLNNYDQRGPESLNGFIGSNCWWMTGLPQKYNRFREGPSQTKLYLVYYEENESFIFSEISDKGPIKREQYHNIEKSDSIVDKSGLWLVRDYMQILEDRQKLEEKSLFELSRRYGEVQICEYNDDAISYYIYCDQFGLKKKNK